jgi:hypothetical protein
VSAAFWAKMSKTETIQFNAKWSTTQVGQQLNVNSSTDQLRNSFDARQRRIIYEMLIELCAFQFFDVQHQATADENKSNLN